MADSCDGSFHVVLEFFSEQNLMSLSIVCARETESNITE